MSLNITTFHTKDYEVVSPQNKQIRNIIVENEEKQKLHTINGVCALSTHKKTAMKKK